MFETWETTKRITEAKRLTERLVGHAHYLLDISENNAIVLYSDKLSKQIPRSYAANSFIAFREALHQIEHFGILPTSTMRLFPRLLSSSITTMLSARLRMPRVPNTPTSQNLLTRTSQQRSGKLTSV